MAQRQLRILHALGAMDPGGVETWLLHVLRYIDRDCFQFHFCTFGPQPGLYAKEIEKLGGKMLRCPRGANLWSFGRRFRRILRDGSYDVVHSHVHFFSGAVLRWAKAEGVPMRIAHSHTSRDEKPNTWARRYYRSLMKSWIDRYATHGLAASRPAAAQLFGENWQADGRFRVLYCGIDLRPFQEPVVREEVRKELGIPVNAPVVGHVGRFVAAKNHHFLLEIAAEILKRRPEIQFLLVGDGPLRPEIEVQARAMGLSEKVHFVGARTDVPRLMRGGMDVFVFPSLWEGMPITVIEAQAAGLHCLTASSITKEVAIQRGAVIFMDLSAGSRDWARQLVQLLDEERIDTSTVPAAIGQGPFSVRHSARDLARIYQQQELQYSSEGAFEP